MNISAASDDASLGAVDFLSPWMSASVDEPGASEVDMRHELFRSMVFDLLRTHCPWLLRVVERAGGQILAGKAAFYIAIPAGSPDWIEVPALSACLHLLPWREGQEEAH